MTEETHNNEHKISRRTFINRSFTGVALMAFAPMADLWAQQAKEVAAWASGSTNYTFHMIGHGHVDLVWLWPLKEGVSVIMSTFQAALDRMNENPDFRFTASSAQCYQWVAENDPAMLEQIRRRIKEGRWSVVGGWWVEPDVNMPCGESLVRQGLYGQLTLEKLVGCRATTGFNPDSFGHTWTIPQILKQQGMDNYTFIRPMPHQKRLDSELFWWEGPDGSRVMTFRIQIGYSNKSDVRLRLERTMKEYKNQPMNTYMSFYGAGDHGGGATKENFKSIAQIQQEPGAPKLIYSTPDAYFQAMAADRSLIIPTLREDLQHEAVGCYTVECGIKKGNRHAEQALLTAEKLTALGSVHWGSKYPHEALTAAWKKVLLLQFHDSLAGTSLVEHSQTARDGFGYALDVADQAITMAMQKLEWQIASEEPESEYIVVFNPHTWAVNAAVEYNFNLKGDAHPVDEHGTQLPCQWTLGTSQTESIRKLIIQTPLPALGYTQIRVKKGAPDPRESDLKITPNSLENNHLRVTFSPSGTIGIFDKATGLESFTGGNTGCRAVVLEDKSDTWSHNIDAFKQECGSFGGATLKVLEEGPLRGMIRSSSTFGDSSLSIDWILCAGSPRLEANVTLDWHEKHKMLKFSFPVAVEQPTSTREIPYGFIGGPTNGNEEPGQRWIDLSGTQGGKPFGLTVINDAKYGYSTQGSDMRISVVRSPIYAHHQPNAIDPTKEYVWMDQGIQTFRMALLLHPGDWREAGIVKAVEEFSAPSIPIYQGIHGGTLPKSGSCLSMDSSHVLITSIKQAEGSNDLIIRCVESCGQSGSATIDLRAIGKTWSGTFKPFEIKSLRVNLKRGSITPVNLLEE